MELEGRTLIFSQVQGGFSALGATPKAHHFQAVLDRAHPVRLSSSLTGDSYRTERSRKCAIYARFTLFQTEKEETGSNN